MRLRKAFFGGLILLFLFSAAISIYKVSGSGGAFRKQDVPMFVLKSVNFDTLNSTSATALAVAVTENDRNIYLFNQGAREISVINSERKTKKNKLTPYSFVQDIAVSMKGNIYVANNSDLNINDAEGNWLSSFPISKFVTSITASNDNEVVVAALDSDELITVFDKSGNVKRKFGNIKQLDRSSATQNRFLNTGKIAADQQGNIYYVSMFSPFPSVQKFSSDGELLKEFIIEGATIDLQSNHADEFLREKTSNCIGGYYVIRAAAVDPETGHLWIGMNGLSEKNSVRAESSVLYEYNSEGEKLAEYALDIDTSSENSRILSDVYEIAVKFPYAYVLTSGGKIYQFNLQERSIITLKERDIKQGNKINSVEEIEACTAETPYTCSATCPSGSTPQSVNCGDVLKSRLNQGEIIISSTCTSGNTVGQNGGCTGSITGCEMV